MAFLCASSVPVRSVRPLFFRRDIAEMHAGGRSVKWLTSIEVSHEESQHYLHFHVRNTSSLAVDRSSSLAHRITRSCPCSFCPTKLVQRKTGGWTRGASPASLSA